MWESEEEARLIKSLRCLDELMSPELWRRGEGMKSAEESDRARAAGNQLFNRACHDERLHAEALRLYTRSAAFAPAESIQLALAYGNRSALLAHLKRYHDCITDLDRALAIPKLSDIHRAKYLCRKVECEAELGMQEAKVTCEETQELLQQMDVSVELKKEVITKLVKAIVKLEKGRFEPPVAKREFELPNAGRLLKESNAECPEASAAVQISYGGIRDGRHLRASRDLPPGQPLYLGRAYCSFPMEQRVHSHCSHCLRFAWAGLPCDGCAQAVYCDADCKLEARASYHEVECRVLWRSWRRVDHMNACRLISVRLLVMALREAGGLDSLRHQLQLVDACTDLRKKGFSNDGSVFANNYRSVYSLRHNMTKKSDKQLETVSKHSAALLYLLARYTRLFTRYFDHEKRSLINNENALFVGKLLSRYQHIVLVNAGTVVRDSFTSTSTDWTWKVPEEQNCVGLYLNPFLSLLNHSCYPNLAKCETPDGRTLLYTIRPIAKDQQIFDSYGPTHCEMGLTQRRDVLFRMFQFNCDCVACKNKWPTFMDMINERLMFLTLLQQDIRGTRNVYDKCDKILESLKDESFTGGVDAIQDLAELYGYSVKMPGNSCMTLQMLNYQFEKLTISEVP